jgi:hypothetical protein
VSTQAETWLEAQMAIPEFRAEYVRALDQKNPTLARWCMRERARVDSTDSTR